MDSSEQEPQRAQAADQACRHCGAATDIVINAQAICLDCYATAGACCSLGGEQQADDASKP
jgi:ribosomal protein L40E